MTRVSRYAIQTNEPFVCREGVETVSQRRAVERVVYVARREWELDRAPVLDLVDRYCSAADPDAGLEADRYVD